MELAKIDVNVEEQWMIRFEKHKGYSRMFKENHLTLGLFFPIES